MCENELFHAEGERLLAQVRQREIDLKRQDLSEALAARVAKINNSSMSRSEKRAALFKCNRNALTEAERSASFLSRIYGVCVLPELLITPYSLPDISKEDVIIHSDPVEIPDLADISQQPNGDSPTSESPIEVISSSTLLITPCIQYVPVCLQPLLPLANDAYNNAIRVCGPSLKKKCSFTSYFRLTLLQAYEQIRIFGIGVVRAPGMDRYIVDRNFTSVNRFLNSFRPVSIRYGGKTNTLVPVIGDILHPAYNYHWPSRISEQLDGCLWSSDVTSITPLSIDVKRFNRFSQLIARYYKKGGDNPSLKLAGITDERHEPSGDESCVLTHLLMYLRRDIPRTTRDYQRSNPLRRYGYFYDPRFGIDYLTSSLSVIISCIRRQQLENEHVI